MVFNRTVVYSGQSNYGKYQVVDMVYDGRPARVLYGDKNSPQSGVARDDSPELLFDYNQRFLEMIMSQRPKRLLVIGGGAFMLPIAAFHRFPDMTIDVVEIDELLVNISRDYFDLPSSSRLNVHIEDGVEFLARTRTRYDMIIIDVFSGYTIPYHFLEMHALTQYRRHLIRRGVVAINFISEYKPRRPRLAHELVTSFQDVFPYLSLYQADPHYYRGEDQNMLLAASDAPMHFDYMQSHQLELLP